MSLRPTPERADQMCIYDDLFSFRASLSSPS